MSAGGRHDRGNDVNEEGTNLKGAWAYVHHQLDARERQVLEAQMSKDPALARHVRALEAAHRELARLLPRSAEDAPALEDRLIRAWEADRAGGGDRARAAEPVPFPWWRRMTYPALAWAAAVVLLFGAWIHGQLRDPLRWEKTASSTVYRGAAPGGQDHAALLGVEARIRHALRAAFRERHPRKFPFAAPRLEGAWQISVAATADQQILVEIAFFAVKGTEPTRSWQEVFTDAHDMELRLPAWARAIMASLLKEREDGWSGISRAGTTTDTQRRQT